MFQGVSAFYRRIKRVWQSEEQVSQLERDLHRANMEIETLRSALADAMFAHFLSSARRVPGGGWELFWLKETKTWAGLAGVELEDKDPADYYLPPSSNTRHSL